MTEPNNGVARPPVKAQYQFNGINSNNSSRGASPVSRAGPIPSSQLPPSRANIPMAQLPPARGTAPVMGLSQRVSQLSVSSQNTPNLSPNKFSASTPNQELQNSVFNDVSPIVPNALESVPLSSTSDTGSKTTVTLPSNTAISNTVSSNSNQKVSQYFDQSEAFEAQLNMSPVGMQQSNPAVQNNLPPFIQSSQPSGQNIAYLSQPNVPKSQTSVGQGSSEMQSLPSFKQAPNVISQQQQTPINSQMTTTTAAQYSSTARQNQNPPSPAHIPPSASQENMLQRQRYPQTVPLNPSPQQFNTGLPPRSSPYRQTTAAPLPSQRYNPQINYNVGPPINNPAISNANGPLNMPPSVQNQQRPPITSSRYPTGPQPQGYPTGPQPQGYPTGPQPQGYPTGPQLQGYPTQQGQYVSQPSVVQTGFSRLWGAEKYDLLQSPNILPPTKVEPPPVNLGQEQLNQANSSLEVFRCTVTKIPETASLLQKSRLPLGLLIHPFKDLNYLPVIQCTVIVRCRSCRTYINPFVYFVDSKRWKCNLCFRVNELPEEFQFDPVSKTYGDPTRRPEIKSSTIEYIAPAEYMLRPPQPAVYLFLLDVSRFAIESGYLEVLSTVLLEEVKNLPGDARTQIGFLAYDSALHFFSLSEGLNQPHEMTILDIEDVFLPTPDTLLVNLRDRMELVEDLLKLLPQRFANSFDSNSALGAALQVAHKMMGATGGRVTAFQCALPNVGPGAVTAREDPSRRTTAETPLLNPANDFYKRLALECSGQQIAVDLFIVNSQYVDIATISGISRFSGGSIHHFPLFKSSRPQMAQSFQRELRRYLKRKIGFEAVMRVRCTRGLTINTFHGNFFVRSIDLLSLPNINPDAAFGMQVAIEENLSESQSVCFQAALLYTSSKGERRIRVHTLCLPIANTLQDVIYSADQQCIIGLLSKMAVDRSMQASLSDAREAFINAAVDVLTSYKFSLNMGNSSSGLLAPERLKLLPLYIAAILKHPAFRIGVPTRLDDRVKAMIDMKTLPLPLLMQQIYPDLYPVHNLEAQELVLNGEEEQVPMPPRLQLSARCLENKGAFLMDCGSRMMILVGPNVSKQFLNEALGVPDYNSINEEANEIPILNNLANQRLHQFINYLNDEKPFTATLQILRDNSPNRVVFLERLIEDRLENSLSYHEFLQHLKTQVK
ncbi:protein transport protein Sec24A [Euwallacea similis]|uniref:protein transport protein Sec24A n=1 Tax=Euwallacea similis TaxID=1736056 RepID=UPI00344BD6A2